MFVMALLEVAEAAERLGVTTRQVQNLVALGELRQEARGVIDEESVERLLAIRQGSHTRAWAENTAWGAVSLLSGGDADWMGATQRSRLRARLRELQARDLVERTRERAGVTRYRAHPSTLGRLREVLVHAGAVGRLGLADSNGVDGYLSVDGLAETERMHGLIRDAGGEVTLRATRFDLDIVRQLVTRSPVLAALDLAESLDVREQRAGLDALDAALRELHG